MAYFNANLAPQTGGGGETGKDISEVTTLLATFNTRGSHTIDLSQWANSSWDENKFIVKTLGNSDVTVNFASGANNARVTGISMSYNASNKLLVVNVPELSLGTSATAIMPIEVYYAGTVLDPPDPGADLPDTLDIFTTYGAATNYRFSTTINLMSDIYHKVKGSWQSNSGLRTVWFSTYPSDLLVYNYNNIPPDGIVAKLHPNVEIEIPKNAKYINIYSEGGQGTYSITLVK